MGFSDIKGTYRFKKKNREGVGGGRKETRSRRRTGGTTTQKS